jgi:hypothetical protein
MSFRFEKVRKSILDRKRFVFEKLQEFKNSNVRDRILLILSWSIIFADFVVASELGNFIITVLVLFLPLYVSWNRSEIETAITDRVMNNEITVVLYVLIFLAIFFVIRTWRLGRVVKKREHELLSQINNVPLYSIVFTFEKI